jgi:hypothetical protein
MFTQVIQGRVKDVDALRTAHDRWFKEVKPGARGFLGLTAGVTDDGGWIGIARFESEDLAMANSERPEQGEWWAETSKLIDGVTFYNCPRVELFMGGGSDNAGFVQVMKYKTTDIDALLTLTKQFESAAPSRPDILGGVSSIAEDGTVFDANYFTSEAEAREGEKREMPPEMQEAMAGFGKLVKGDVEYIDLRDPWLH